jgi:hypothetical protein
MREGESGPETCSILLYITVKRDDFLMIFTSTTHEIISLTPYKDTTIPLYRELMGTALTEVSKKPSGLPIH